MAGVEVAVPLEESGSVSVGGDTPARSELVLRRSRILLAEDDTALRHLLADVFLEDGYDVTLAKDGVDLLCQLGASSLFGGIGDAPDAIVSDLSMPGWTGLDALAGLRRSGREIPVVLITAFADDKLRQAAAALGVMAVLEKPFDLATLRSLVHDLAPRGWRFA
jgi:CheY-like chemotaxis protein